MTAPLRLVWCGDTNLPYRCNLPLGHPGDHCERQVVASWQNRTPDNMMRIEHADDTRRDNTDCPQ